MHYDQTEIAQILANMLDTVDISFQLHKCPDFQYFFVGFSENDYKLFIPNFFDAQKQFVIRKEEYAQQVESSQQAKAYRKYSEQDKNIMSLGHQETHNIVDADSIRLQDKILSYKTSYS